jgi:DNA-binding response OmpR family regulator
MSSGKKVLIVDDEPNILIALEFLIRQEGYEVHKAQDGQQALQVLNYFKPQIAILDVMMPRMDGFELAKRIRDQEELADTAIVFLTAKGTQEDRFKGYANGAEVYLTKPFDNQELIDTINDLISYH